jgi:hypothetical protein
MFRTLYVLCQLSVLTGLLWVSLHCARGSPGAAVPWTTYEAEDMTTTGTVMGPGYAPNTVEAESSGRKCVKLEVAGQYLEFTAQAAANALVVRYGVPDSPDGTGVDTTISLYRNGQFLQKIPLTSKYSWLYGGYPFSNSPEKGSPRNFYDEVRLKGLPIVKGDVLRLKKEADDTAAYCIVDLIDLENVAPPLAAPANSLSLLDYGAKANGDTDDTAALRACIAAAEEQGKAVWAPAGAYLMAGDIDIPAGLTIQGAGMWHTVFVGDAAQYRDFHKRVRFNGGGSNIHLSDFAILGKLNFRNDSEPNDGVGESFGVGSTLSRLWVEHTKTGAWLVNSSGLIVEGCRFRNTVADGINFCVGMRSSIITNCTARGTGDDCFAIWPATYRAQSYAPGLNVITHCTGQLPFLANGAAIYGGEANRVEDGLFKDLPYGCGLLISGTFPTTDESKKIDNSFRGTTVAQRCDLIRCGGYDPGLQWRAALQLYLEHHSISDLNLNHLNIIDSISDGLSVIAPGSNTQNGQGTLSKASMDSVNIPNYGLGDSGRHGFWAASSALGTVTITHSTIVEYKNDSSYFAIDWGGAPPVKQP